MPSIPQVTLAGKSVGQMGFGLMQLTWTPNPPSDEVSFAAMKAAADAGATAWSTACFYGNEENPWANLELIARFFKKYPEYEEKIVLVVKGGFPIPSKEDLVNKYREELVKTKSILGNKVIDVYSAARLPPGVPPEQVFEALKTLKEEGLFIEVGASETSAPTLRKAAKIVPIAIIEIEVSLWSYEQEIQEVITWSKETKVPVFCYSPLGRGFITRTYKTPDDIPDGAFIKYLPRFQGKAFYDNLKLVDQLDVMAEKKGLTTPQLALAWICNISPYNIPIPGSSNPERVKQNIEAAAIKLSKEDLEELDKTLSSFPPIGGRYPDAMNGLQMQ
ncbi:NADP-dependent oxidoreductase domain-containing protein [Naematelia encephala]|uniref:NADP-dependent oxidoreductase domain-containing protein n=1 Tax=Naematelia encephala TaxID=71784 RepID=A0A1Y2BCW7_9TREE|nr:NADP-dependent oxidoreductase domain-containing protein [Naematelia encephala]